MAAANNFKLRVMKMKKRNGPRLQHFLQQIEGTDSFNEIIIVKHDNDLEEFEAKKQRVFDDVLQNVQERFDYLENNPSLKLQQYWIQTFGQKMRWNSLYMVKKKYKCWQITTRIIC